MSRKSSVNVSRDIAILQRRIAGAAYGDIAKEFGLNAPTVGKIVARQVVALAALEASSQLEISRLESALIEEQRHSDDLARQLDAMSLSLSELKSDRRGQENLIVKQAKQLRDIQQRYAELKLSMEEWKARALQRASPERVSPSWSSRGK